tara:strand:- start:91242 stop:94217 length:2976 start_codon:yes stop_codon:yes gene_type:complete
MATCMVGYTQTKFWVTVENEETLIEGEINGVLLRYKQALPSSRKNDLNKVYEIETDQVTSFLRFVKTNRNINKPQIIEQFQPLYDPNDITLNFSTDYTLDLINAREAWDLTKGSPTIEIGVFDTNFDTIHEELTGEYSHYEPNNNTNTTHGTAVAIMAAGKTDNAVGKSSIGFNCGLRLYRMNFNDMLEATYSGVRVINISWAAGCTPNPYYQDVINEIHSNGSVIVAAAGNGSTCGGPNQDVYPASYDNVISVTSIDQWDKHMAIDNDPTSCHQHNSNVDLTAPGYNVPLSISGNQYLTGNGTSFAAPVVSGVIGLMLSVNNCLTPDEIEQILKETAVDIYSVNQLYLGKLGAGRIDAKAAVERAKELHPIKYSIHEFTNTCNLTEAVFVSLDSGTIADHTIQWSNNSHDWALYNLTEDNYEFTIANSNGCVVHDEIDILPSEIEYDYDHSIYISSSADELIDQNQDGLIRVKGTIVVQDGADFQIKDKTIEFSDNADLSYDPDMPQSGIVVKPGSNLLLENCILRQVTSCSQLFGGIEVLANEVGEKGELEIVNCHIENADVAISNIHKSQIGYSPNRGGKITLIKSTFKNNRRSIHVFGNGRSSSALKIIDNSFIIDSLLANTTQVYVENANIHFRHNSIVGNIDLLPEQRGIGLVLKNAKLVHPQTKPNYNSYLNEYNLLSVGVKIDSCKGSEILIRKSLFEENLTGLQIQNSKNVIIKKSEFIIPSGNYPQYASGILQQGESQSKLFENTFVGLINDLNHGIHLVDQDAEESVIHSNEFDGSLTNGIKVEGENVLRSLSCNDFDIEGNNDLSIVDSDDQNGQLVRLDTTGLNDFSHCENVLNNISNEASGFQFFYRDATDYIPECTQGVIYVDEIDISIDRSNECATSLDKYKSETDIIEGISSIEENKESKQHFIYPNPNQGSFTLTIENVKNIKVYNSTGKLIHQQEGNIITKLIDLKLSTGIYTVVASNNTGELFTQKMIVNQ